MLASGVQTDHLPAPQKLLERLRLIVSKALELRKLIGKAIICRHFQPIVVDTGATYDAAEMEDESCGDRTDSIEGSLDIC